MVYLFETQLPQNTSVSFALRRIYGINKTYSLLLCKKLGFTNNLKIKNLSKDQINDVLKLVEILNINTVSDLKKLKLLAAKNLISIKSYRGFRRNKGLPVRGQRTHTNAKTSRKKFI